MSDCWLAGEAASNCDEVGVFVSGSDTVSQFYYMEDLVTLQNDLWLVTLGRYRICSLYVSMCIHFTVLSLIRFQIRSVKCVHMEHEKPAPPCLFDQKVSVCLIIIFQHPSLDSVSPAVIKHLDQVLPGQSILASIRLIQIQMRQDSCLSCQPPTYLCAPVSCWDVPSDVSSLYC